MISNSIISNSSIITSDMILSTISWEDPLVEIEILQQISLSDPCPTVLMMGKSMDSAIALSGLSKFLHHITILCHSDFEEALINLKINLLNTYHNPIDRMKFLDGSHPPSTMNIMYTELAYNMTASMKLFWNKNRDLIYNGLIYKDSWMKLFKCVKDRTEPNKISKIFNYRDLLKIMDKNIPSYDSIINSIKVPFSKYIRQVYLDLIEDYKNPYSSLIINCKYDYTMYPKMFDSGRINSYSISTLRKGPVIEYLLEYSEEEYSMISLSNLTDIILSIKDLELLIKYICKHLKPDGRAIFRRRATDFELYPLINKQMIIVNHQYNQFIDHTHLYNELIVATPRSTKIN
ncbi:MAG: hypothetical protein WD512_19850 [Candidatus Paceibacterota bacterium]